MKVQKISVKNAAYQKFTALLSNRKKRRKHNEFITEGVRNINEAIKNHWQINSFIYSGERQLSEWARNILANIKTNENYELTENLMRDLSGKEDTSELIAIVRMKENKKNEPLFTDNPILALFDRPSNKGNLGTIIRSCDAFGAEQLIITGHSVDIYDPDVINSSMGSFFKLPFINLSDNSDIDDYLSGLKQKYPQIKKIGTTSHNKISLYDIDMTTPVLFLIGNETDGLNRRYLEICDLLATIPMSINSSASSFNVSCAATVMLYEATRQRNACFQANKCFGQ